MPILTRYERWALMLLTIGFLASSVLLLFSSGPSAVCLTPAKFTSEMAGYARRVCSSAHARLHDVSPAVPENPVSSQAGKRRPISYPPSGVSKWVQGLPKRLFYSMVLVLIPLMVADSLTRVFDAVGAGEKRLSTTSIVIKSAMELCSRIGLFVCLATALYAFNGEPAELRSRTSSRVLLCDFSSRNLANIARYTVQCVISPGQRLVIAALVTDLVKRILTAVMVWAVIGVVQSFILFVCPSTRQTVLGARPKSRNAEPLDCEMQEIE